MGLFGKSFDEQVRATTAELWNRFPGARVSAKIEGKIVTLTGTAPDRATRRAILKSFNQTVETENTINQITVEEQEPAKPKATPEEVTEMTSKSPLQVIHEVVRGDTLSAIARKYYGNAGRYMKIFEANRDVLDNPDLIKVGQRLKIPS